MLASDTGSPTPRPPDGQEHPFEHLLRLCQLPQAPDAKPVVVEAAQGEHQGPNAPWAASGSRGLEYDSRAACVPSEPVGYTPRPLVRLPTIGG